MTSGYINLNASSKFGYSAACPDEVRCLAGDRYRHVHAVSLTRLEMASANEGVVSKVAGENQIAKLDSEARPHVDELDPLLSRLANIKESGRDIGLTSFPLAEPVRHYSRPRCDRGDRREDCRDRRRRICE
jgi:hypothetical protein